MKIIGSLAFPEASNAKECEEWKPVVRHRALHRCVLTAAKTRIEGQWAAYCKDVSGANHLDCIEDVLAEGAKMSESVARALYPEFAEIPYAK